MNQKRILTYGISLVTSICISLVAVRFDTIAAFIIQKNLYNVFTPAPVGHWTMDAINTTGTQILDNSGNNKHGTLQGYELYSCDNIGWSANSAWNLPDVGWSSSPTFGDLDSDGDFDALVGSKDSLILGYENTGTVSSPIWTAKTSWNLNTGGGSDTYPAPELADIDNDGDLDLFLGNNKADDFQFYRNTGSASSPVWTYYNNWRIPNKDSWNAPALGDLDGDGDLDALGGTAWGQVQGYVNSGSKTSPIWEYFTFWDTEKMEIMTNKQPALTDLDKDGDLDLLIGGNDSPSDPGYVLAYRNTWNGSGPVWTRWPAWDPPTHSSAHAQPGIVDIDGDGDDDVVVGYTDGVSRVYINTGTCESSVSDHLVPGALAQGLDFDGINDSVTIGAVGASIKSVSFWLKADDTTNRSILALNGSARITLNAAGQIATAGFTNPTIYIDGVVANTLPDMNWHQITITTNTSINASAMTIGFANNSYFDGAIDDLQIYTQVLSAGDVASTLEPVKKVIISPSAVESDDTDLKLHYSFDGSFTSDTSTEDSGAGGVDGALVGGTLQNCSPAWRAKPEWNTPSAGGHDPRTPMPALADLDGDDDLDLVIGTNSFGPYGFINVGTVTVPTWSLKTAWNMPHPATYEDPTFADFDNDGDYDAMLGTRSGTAYAYRNAGSVSSPVWSANSAWNIPDPSGNDDWTHPMFGDLDGDGDLDLMMGPGYGKIVGYKNQGTASSPNWIADSSWNTPSTTQDNAFTQKDGVLADLDMDGDLDLMFGSNEGQIRVYKNNGSVSAPVWVLNTDTSWHPPDHTSGRISLGDLDNDGDLDLLVADSAFDGARALGYENIGTCQQGGFVEPVPGKLGQALGFDGVGNFVDVGNTGQTINSIAFWMMASDTTSRGIMKLSSSANITLNASSQIVATGFTNPTIYVDGIATSTIPDTGWHHVVISTGTGVSVSDLEIGRSGTSYFSGTLDDIRMYSRELSAGDASQQKKLGELVIDPSL